MKVRKLCMTHRSEISYLPGRLQPPAHNLDLNLEDGSGKDPGSKISGRDVGAEPVLSRSFVPGGYEAMPPAMRSPEGLTSLLPCKPACLGQQREGERALRGMSHLVPRERSQPAQGNCAQEAIAPRIPARSVEAGLAAGTGVRLDAEGGWFWVGFLIPLGLQRGNVLILRWKGSAATTPRAKTPKEEAERARRCLGRPVHGSSFLTPIF